MSTKPKGRILGLLDKILGRRKKELGLIKTIEFNDYSEIKTTPGRAKHQYGVKIVRSTPNDIVNRVIPSEVRADYSKELYIQDEEEVKELKNKLRGLGFKAYVKETPYSTAARFRFPMTETVINKTKTEAKKQKAQRELDKVVAFANKQGINTKGINVSKIVNDIEPEYKKRTLSHGIITGGVKTIVFARPDPVKKIVKQYQRTLADITKAKALLSGSKKDIRLAEEQAAQAKSWRIRKTKKQEIEAVLKRKERFENLSQVKQFNILNREIALPERYRGKQGIKRLKNLGEEGVRKLVRKHTRGGK